MMTLKPDNFSGIYGPGSVFLLLAFVWLLYSLSFLTGVLKLSTRDSFSWSTDRLDIHRNGMSMMGSGPGFYDVIASCDNILPTAATMQIMLPVQPDKRRLFLEGKGRYFLYPRNYGNNNDPGDYVLQYLVPDADMPPGLRRCVSFGPDKALWARTTCPAGHPPES